MEYKKINTREYVEKLIQIGVKPRQFIKATPVVVSKAVAGEVVETLVKNKETGAIMKETDNIARTGDWIVKNKGGEVYIVSNANFHKLYGDSDKEGIRYPISNPRTLIQVKENISFEAPWGGEMKIQAGGWLNLDNMDAIYGINPEEFNETHVLYEREKDR